MFCFEGRWRACLRAHPAAQNHSQSEYASFSEALGAEQFGFTVAVL